MTDLGKLLMLGGGFLLLIGAIVWLLGRSGFRGMPGDISYQSDHARFYFPIVSCIVLSLALTAVLWIVQWLGRK
ncbi:MAG TPA: DUF2905 domain-containing protein [Tepidisphaeraceae bacterium]|nr:DUF2905 domain-containing protein [Tepidisphaeraceae bacterium]